MKKAIKFLASFWTCSLLLGCLIEATEKQREKKNREKRKKEGWQTEREEHRPYGSYEAYVKRPLEFSLALMALLFLSPVYLVVAILVRIKLGKPVLFKQERPGKAGKLFQLYKFRTMTEERDEKGELLPDEERLPEFGRWLRSTSLDELPELLNVLKGEMSLVGPRPLLVEYLPRYSAKQARRHEVRPGLTGLAQVKGRNAISWEEKFADDVEYVDHITFWMDVKIIFRTIAVVFQRTGINSDTSVTMEAFMGNESGKADEILRKIEM